MNNWDEIRSFYAAAHDAKLKSLGWTVYRISGKACRDGVGSEGPSQSEARKFIQNIAIHHPVQRG